MTVYLYRMPVGIAGAISRPDSMTVEPVGLRADNTFSAYGLAGKYDDDGYFVPLAAGDTADAIKGIYVRPYPTTATPDLVRQTTNGSNFFGDALKRGYMTVRIGTDATTVKKGGAVHVLLAADDSVDIPPGGFLAAAIANKTVVLPNAEFTGPGDADGNAEISWKI